MKKIWCSYYPIRKLSTCLLPGSERVWCCMSVNAPPFPNVKIIMLGVSLCINCFFRGFPSDPMSWKVADLSLEQAACDASIL